MTAIKLIETEDGSHSLYVREMNETYHSTHGALTESKHVFLKEGVSFWLMANDPRHINILEVGFGTGLNALMMLDFAKSNPELTIDFFTLEPFPIGSDLYHQLNFASILNHVNREELLAMHELGDEEKWDLDNFHFMKTMSKVEDATFKEAYDVVFFDAFAPNKQAEVWGLDVLSKMYQALKPGGILTTYCAQGQFKRNLAAAGFMLKTLEGPPGKKEMVRGTKE